MGKRTINALERLGLLSKPAVEEPPKTQRTYVVVLGINPDVSVFSVTGHLIDNSNGGNCIPLEGRPAWEHLQTVTGQLQKLLDAGAITLADAILEGKPRVRGLPNG